MLGFTFASKGFEIFKSLAYFLILIPELLVLFENLIENCLSCVNAPIMGGSFISAPQFLSFFLLSYP